MNVGGDSTYRNVLVSHECWAGGQSGMCFNDGPYHYCLRYEIGIAETYRHFFMKLLCCVTPLMSGLQ